ncbi:MAG: GNAT family N-acetyltransferase [Anaerolineaceae bacterium]|nr:GNAT family N-acetyltransferase [Anaerolineaceae bacterium]
MYIKQNDIVVRSATLEDAEILTTWWNDGSVMAHAGYPRGLGTTIEAVKSGIKEKQNSLAQRCIIEVSNQRIGECNYNLKDNQAEIGIKLCDDSFQNRGLGTKVLKMLIEFLFTDKNIANAYNLEKIILDTNAKNTRAQHVYEKLRFRKVRTNIDVWRDQLGELQTSIDYEMTIEDFKKHF